MEKPQRHKGHKGQKNSLCPLCLCGSLFLICYSTAGFCIENTVPQKLLRCPRWRRAAQIFMEPFQVGSVIKRHLVPARPVTRIREDYQFGWDVHLLQCCEELQRLCVGNTVVTLACNNQTRGLEVLCLGRR